MDENKDFKVELVEYIAKRGMELQDALINEYEGFCNSEPESVKNYRQAQGAVPELICLAVDMGLKDELNAVLDRLKAGKMRKPCSKQTGSDGE